MRHFAWSEDKNRDLKANAHRAVCFEDIVAAIESGGLLDDVEHVNAVKYPHQRMFVVLLGKQVYGVPYVMDGGIIFLKTAYPSRKLVKAYLDE